MERNRILLNVVLWTGTLVYACGCSSAPFGMGGSSAQVSETGVGHQLGTAVGAQMGGRYGYVGSVLGGAVGSQTEKAMIKGASGAGEPKTTVPSPGGN